MKKLITALLLVCSLSVMGQKNFTSTVNKVYSYNKATEEWVLEKTTYVSIKISFTERMISVDNKGQNKYYIYKLISTTPETSEKFGVYELSCTDASGVKCICFTMTEGDEAVGFMVLYDDIKITYKRE